jgi:hypothetical protein
MVLHVRDPSCRCAVTDSGRGVITTLGFFLTKIFHPNVAESGEICVSTLKRDWKREYGIQHILLVRPHTRSGGAVPVRRLIRGGAGHDSPSSAC